jgi:hypothetical protein
MSADVVEEVEVAAGVPEEKNEGPVSAAIIAGGVGTLALGVLTTLAAASESVADALALVDRVGPLAGKTVFAVVIWLIAWGILHAMLKDTRYETKRALTLSLILVAVGVVGTFPTFFEAFAAE